MCVGTPSARPARPANSSIGSGPSTSTAASKRTARPTRAGDANDYGANIDYPGRADFGAFHEALHSIGMVNECAEHFNPNAPGHVNDDKTDVMYTGSEPWSPAELDVGRDDYFEHDIPNCPDLADSVFLDPLPADAQVPPGWPANP